MKPRFLQRLKARLAVSRHKKKQGVAILTVLAIITLMTVLVVSFFNMATTAKVTAKGSVEIQRVTTMKDTIINLVIAQFREASRLAPPNASNPRDIITWISQPGAIRTFSGNPTDFSKNRLYKLYSSDVPQIGDIRPFATGTLLDEINKDNVPDWADRPDEYTDLNRPVYTAATGDRARATGSVDSTGYSYPIVDPRAYNGRDGALDSKRNIEGFTYSGTSGSTRIRGIDPQLEQLAMPVRWIYLLQDGTLGYLDENKEFKELNGVNSGKASRENPIVGRLAWWADDESCKINVNTASVPAAWDTPRTTSMEDQWLAKNQPIAGEFQRYPGHPATVDLCAVFYPSRRWVPSELQGLLAGGSNPAGGKMDLLAREDANRIWDLAPFIVGDVRDVKSGSTGTGGGSYPTPPESTVGGSTDDRLFTSMDEVYFKASGPSNKSLNAPRSHLLSEGKDGKLEFLETLQRAQFFLTHKSHSPELTNQGFPRVSMFPMDLLAVPAVGSTGALPEGVSPYDVTMALNSTIGGKSSIAGGNAYFFQRRDPNSRHNEFYGGTGRNVRVFKYLKELSKLPIPGYPEAVPFKVASTSAEDGPGLALASKYSPGLNGTGTATWGNAYGASSMFDSSDRTQILLNMLDYTRSINMQPPFLTGPARYDDAFGKAAGVCGCGSAAGVDTNVSHYNCLLHSNQTSRSPKGTGKLYAAAEIAIVVNVAAKRGGGAASDPVSGPWGALFSQMSAASQTRANSSDAGTRYIVEVGFIMSGFNPKHGWSPTFPCGGLAVSAADPKMPTGGTEVASADGSLLPIIGPGQEQLTISGANRMGGKNEGDRALAKGPGASQGISPLGGMSGPRALFSTGAGSLATTKPFCVILPTANDANVPVGLKADPNLALRVMVADGLNTYDITQATELALPGDFFSGVTPELTNEALRTLVTKYAQGTVKFPDPRLFIRSFVLPHGDYRLPSGASRVDADVYVPHEQYNKAGPAGRLAHSFYEMNTNPSNRAMGNSLYSTTIGLMDPLVVPKYEMPNGNPQPEPKLTGLPFPRPFAGLMGLTQVGALRFPGQDAKILKQASRNQLRQATFAHGRRDGRGVVPNRGSSDPMETGDFDTGVAATPDGPYMNYPDEGDRRINTSDSYYRKMLFTVPKPTTAGTIGGQNISPNFLVRSPVDFGSIPTGVANRVPWQTLRFRPDYGMNDPAVRMTSINDEPPVGKPFANFCGPRDHFFLDMFWMPVVEPWSISEPFSTKGTINLNQQIYPFMYIDRTTALHALMRGERMAAIPNDAADKYKNVSATTGEPAGSQDATYRHFINAKETVRQFTKRYKEGADSDPLPNGGNQLAFNVFRSASEICEMWLVPENPTSSSNQNTLETVIGTISGGGNPQGFWAEHLLTGDNLRERPYANLYPRVTVRSNVFKLHMVAQTLQKALSMDPKKFDSVHDSITAEWRGSCMIERSIDPRDTGLTNIDYTNLNAQTIDPRTTPKLDRYYNYRVTEVKQLTQ